MAIDLIRAIASLNVLPIWQRHIRVWDCQFTAPSLDRFAALLLHRIGWMGKSEKRFFESRIRPGMVVVDIGANQGLYTLLFAHLVGATGNVIAFEPEEDMFRALVHNLAKNFVTNVETHQVAIGSESGVANLSKSLIHGGDNSLRAGHHKSVSRTETVRLTTLDEMADNRRIDFIKIDVQGWEAQVLCGMKKVLETNPEIEVLFEYWPRGLMDSGADLQAPLQFLHDAGFHITRLIGEQEVPLGDYSKFIASLKKNQFVDLHASRKLPAPLPAFQSSRSL